MKIGTTKNGEYKIFAETLEPEAETQIIRMAESEIGKDAHIRIMPDAHAGAGCTIGTTMKIKDKVCPNIVGVDIGCGVTFAKTTMKIKGQLEHIDKVIREVVPSGFEVQKDDKFAFEKLKEMKCWEKLSPLVQEKAMLSSGTLGGGNHFIECYSDGSISVHTGSRNIGLEVAKYYQKLAVSNQKVKAEEIKRTLMQNIEPGERENWIKQYYIEHPFVPDDLAYLESDDMKDYLFDMKICQEFADYNRHLIIKNIVKEMKGKVIEEINSIHNYIDTESMILRKGAIDASEGKKLVIPLNMRDGILICIGKGNEDWNYSAPHGAGRLYSRSDSKNKISLSAFKKSMVGIYSTCICEGTIDESPMAYKDSEEIRRVIEPTVEIVEQIKPVYNFKATE